MVREDYDCILTKYSTSILNALSCHHRKKNIHFFLHYLPLVRMWGQFIGNLPMEEEVRGNLKELYGYVFLKVTLAIHPN